MAKVKFVNCKIDDGVIGISMPAVGGPDFVLKGTSLSGNEVAVQVRDPVANLGFLPETPPAEVARILQEFAKAAPHTPEAAEAALQPTGAERWLAATTNLTSLGNTLLDWSTKGYITAALQQLLG